MSGACEDAMALIDSKTGKVIRDYSVEELQQAANLMRGYDLVVLAAAASGHAGGTLSIMDITAALYLKSPTTIPSTRIGKTATASSGRRDTKRRRFISGWPSPDITNRKTWSRCASWARPTRDIRTG